VWTRSARKKTHCVLETPVGEPVPKLGAKAALLTSSVALMFALDAINTFTISK
jgi:hypothetical protein